MKCRFGVGCGVFSGDCCMCLSRGNVATSGCCVVVCLCLFPMSFALLDVFVSDSVMFGTYIVQCETHRGVGILILSSRGNCVQLLYVMCFQTCFRGKCGYKVT